MLDDLLEQMSGQIKTTLAMVSGATAQRDEARAQLAALLDRQAAMVLALARAEERLQPYLDLAWDLNCQRDQSMQKVSRYHEFLDRASRIVKADWPDAEGYISQSSKAQQEAWAAKERASTLARELAAAREALARYGGHLVTCRYKAWLHLHPLDAVPEEPPPCSCGFAALAEPRAGEETT